MWSIEWSVFEMKITAAPVTESPLRHDKLQGIDID
jgi:hypothetical protein